MDIAHRHVRPAIAEPFLIQTVDIDDLTERDLVLHPVHSPGDGIVRVQGTQEHLALEDDLARHHLAVLDIGHRLAADEGLGRQLAWPELEHLADGEGLFRRRGRNRIVQRLGRV